MRRKGYDPTRLIEALEGLLAERNESYREASLRAGLDHGALYRFLQMRKRPSPRSLLMLADHFAVNPNDLLVLAGYPPLAMFERKPADMDNLSPDVRLLVEDLEQIGDPALRKRLVEAIRLLLKEYIEKARARKIVE